MFRLRSLRARVALYFTGFGALLSLVMTLLSALAGIGLSRATVAPVADLASRMRHLRPEDWDQLLAADFRDREIEELAGVFDRQLLRMQAFIERERAFSADMSHELRTALAVILSATEVLLGDESLVRNAFSYTAAGKVSIRQGVHALTVSDTGLGIPGAAVDQVFLRHFRDMASQGAGIGLTLVKRICDRHGWRVRLESGERQGTSVTIEFANAR